MKAIKSIGKDLEHQKTKFLQKYGSTEKTVDTEFEEQKEKYDKLHRDLSNILKDANKTSEFLKAILSPLLSLSESLDAFYEEPYEHGVKFRAGVMGVDSALRDFLDRQKEFQFNLEEQLGKINALRKKIIRREDILLEHDKYKTQVIKLTASPAKDPSKLWEAEKKLEEKKQLYKQINTELMEEMKQLNDSKFRDFRKEYELLASNLLKFFNTAQGCYQSLIDETSVDMKIYKAPANRKNISQLPIVENETPSTQAPPTLPSKDSSSNLMNDSDDDPIDNKPTKAPPSLPHKEETKQEPHKESSDHQKPLPIPQKPATKTSDPPKEKPIPNPKPNADTQPTRPLPNPARKSTIAPTKPIPNPKPQNQESSENHNQPPPKEKPLPNPKPNHPPSEDHTKQAPRPQRIQSLLIEPKPTQMQTNTQPNAFYTDFGGGFPTFPDGDNSFSTSFSTSQDAQIQLPPLPGRTSSNFDFNPFEEGEPFHDPPRKLSSADYNNQTPMLPPSLPRKESSSIQNKIDDMASDAVANAATNEKYQKAVGNAVASQAVKQENQKKFGEAIASGTDNPILKSLATNSTVQGLAGKAVSKAATNETVQKQVGNKIAETAKDDEAKKKLGSGVKGMLTKFV